MDIHNCVDLSADSNVRAQGKLTLRHFPGPPNYDDIKSGDADEETYILVMPEPSCISDGSEGFADPARHFRTVHIYSDTKLGSAQLRASIGKGVIVEGEGFAAETGHHHAPLVLRVLKLRRTRVD